MEGNKYYRLLDLFQESIEIINNDARDNFDAISVLDILIIKMFEGIKKISKEEKLKVLLNEMERVLSE